MFSGKTFSNLFWMHLKNMYVIYSLVILVSSPTSVVILLFSTLMLLYFALIFSYSSAWLKNYLFFFFQRTSSWISLSIFNPFYSLFSISLVSVFIFILSSLLLGSFYGSLSPNFSRLVQSPFALFFLAHSSLIIKVFQGIIFLWNRVFPLSHRFLGKKKVLFLLSKWFWFPFHCTFLI